MRYPKGIQTHGSTGCCPQEWRQTPNITGQHELDAVIRHNPNKDMPKRLQMYCGGRNLYGPLTGYNAYHGYQGDN